jgi:hypothetical protein
MTRGEEPNGVPSAAWSAGSWPARRSLVVMLTAALPGCCRHSVDRLVDAGVDAEHPSQPGHDEGPAYEPRGPDEAHHGSLLTAGSACGHDRPQSAVVDEPDLGKVDDDAIGLLPCHHHGVAQPWGGAGVDVARHDDDRASLDIAEPARHRAVAWRRDVRVCDVCTNHETDLQELQGPGSQKTASHGAGNPTGATPWLHRERMGAPRPATVPRSARFGPPE